MAQASPEQEQALPALLRSFTVMGLLLCSLFFAAGYRLGALSYALWRANEWQNRLRALRRSRMKPGR